MEIRIEDGKAFIRTKGGWRPLTAAVLAGLRADAEARRERSAAMLRAIRRPRPA